MFSTLRTRFGIPGVISVMALVFAMFGGAYAASNSSDAGKATASAKAKQGPRGKTGKTGPAGPAGPAGPTGPAGATGPKGDAGSAGSNGAPGTAGKSVTSASFEGTNEPASEPCEERGGTSFEVDGSGVKNYACNGAAGQNGQTGFTETLPIGKTETGLWSVQAAEVEGQAQEVAFSSFSFNIPLASDGQSVYVPQGGPNPDPNHCPGSSETPKASSGYLCVYGETEVNTSLFTLSDFTVGARVGFNVAELPGIASGSFAVTG